MLPGRAPHIEVPARASCAQDRMQQLVFVAKDTEPLLCSATEIMIHEPAMAIVAADMDKNVQMFQCVFGTACLTWLLALSVCGR